MSKWLEALEKLMDDVNQCVNSGGIHYIDKRNYDIIEKELKALDIIKNKQVNVRNLILTCLEYHKKYLDYVDDFYFGDNFFELGTDLLIKEEYDLLKEVML